MNISQKGQKRYENIMEAGLELFLKNGYENTSLSQIVAKSGGSLASVYKFFENKEKLFALIVQREFENFRQEIELAIKKVNHKDLSEFLNSFGLIYLEIFCKPENIKFVRIIISETHKNKELGKILKNLISNTCIKTLTDFFKKPQIAPLFKQDIDPQELAFNFCALIREPFFLHNLILGEEQKLMNEYEKRDMVSKVVDSFLNGIYK